MDRMTAFLALGALLCLGLAAPTAEGAPLYEIDYAKYDVRVKDHKSSVIDATNFGFFTGPNVLYARRGDGFIEIPFRKIRTLEMGTYVPSKGTYPCTVTSRRGRAFQVHVERVEGQRFLGGDTDIGTYRVRLGQIQRLDLLRLSNTEDFD